MYAMPMVGYVPLLLRNLTVLEKAGINPADGTPTFDVFLDQLAKIQAAGIYPTHSWSGHWFTAGSILGAEESLTIGVQNKKTTVTASQLLPTMQMLTKIKAYSNNMSNFDDVAIEAFKKDQMGFIAEGPWSVPGYDDSGVRYDIVPIPAFKAGGRTGGLRGLDACYGIDNGDKAKNDAMARWLLFMTAKDQLLEYAVKMGRPALRTDVMNDPGVQKEEVGRVSAKAILGGIDQTDFFRTTVFWPQPIGDISVRVASGEISPQQGADLMIQEINARYAEE
jgi:multiple sugar transport system substrate-binding protein